jgi:hypothetical protein
MIDRAVAREIAQFGAVREKHRGAVHPLDDVQPVTRGHGVDVAVGPCTMTRSRAVVLRA